MGHIRRNTAKIATVAEARSRKRATDEEKAEMPPEQRQNPTSEPCQNSFGKMMKIKSLAGRGRSEPATRRDLCHRQPRRTADPGFRPG